MKKLALSLLLWGATAHAQSLVVTSGTPTESELNSNICINSGSTPLRTYFPGGINLGTTEITSSSHILMLPNVPEAVIGIAASTGDTGNSIQIRAGAGSNGNGGAMVVGGGASSNSGYSYTVIGADSAGQGSLQYFQFATGRPNNASNPLWLAGNWMAGNLNLQSAIELSVVSGQNDDVDLLQSNSTGIDSTVYTVSSSVGGNFSISGLCLGSNAPGIRGAVVILRNNSNYDMTIMDESTSSTEGCRIQTNTDDDRSTTGKGAVILYYGDEQRWQVLSFDP